MKSTIASYSTYFKMMFHKVLVLLACVAITCVMADSGKHKGQIKDCDTDDIAIHYTVENDMASEMPMFKVNEKVCVPAGSNAFTVMQQGAAQNNKMLFVHEMRSWGAFITEINGVHWDPVKEIFWAFMKKNSSGLCLHNFGVSNYNPANNEKMILSFETYNIFNIHPNCVTGGPHV